MSAVEFRSVALARGPRPILSRIDARIQAGEFIGVFGPNGAGKTTLLHAILGLLPPASGTIRVFGKPPGTERPGYLPQKRSGISDLRLRGWDLVASAYEGHRWGPPLLGARGRGEVAWALETVDATELAERPLSELSGGERQRVLLAQALLGKPRLLLLDEPLIGLDPRYQQSVVELIKQVQRTLGITVLLTAHELNPLIGLMDRVLYLGHGHAALGTTDEVITSEVLSRLYDAPIEVLRLNGRVVVVAAHGEVETEAHRHDA
jgi:zinc/manganese transport system ATP-binding protein